MGWFDSLRRDKKSAQARSDEMVEVSRQPKIAKRILIPPLMKLKRRSFSPLRVMQIKSR